MTKPPPNKKKHTPWDDAYKQLMQVLLTDLGLKVLQDITLGDLPLEADLVILSKPEHPDKNEWKNHPLWQHCTDQSLIEFKSVGDKFLTGSFEKLLAYTLFYRLKYHVSYDTELSSWLILPTLNKSLKTALKHYNIALEEILPGFWKGHTLFPLYIIAYNDLPFEQPYHMLKLFIRSGQPVQKLFADVLKSEQREKWLAAIQHAMALIHPKDFQEVLKKMGLAAERKELHKTIRELLKDDIDKEIEQERQASLLKGKLEGKLEALKKTARQMKADGMPVDVIRKYTGLSQKELATIVSETLSCTSDDSSANEL